MTCSSAVFGDPMNFTLSLGSFSNIKPTRFLISFYAGKSGAQTDRIAMACSRGEKISRIDIRFGAQAYSYQNCVIESFKPGSAVVEIEVSYASMSYAVRG